MVLYEYPGYVTAEWDDTIKATVQHWTNMDIPLAEYKKMMQLLLKISEEKQTKNWVSDSSKTDGELNEACAKWLAEEFAPNLLISCVEFIVSIVSPDKEITEEQWQRRGNWLFVIKTVTSFEEGIEWLNEQN